MAKRKDLTGQVFDELTVVEMLWNYENRHRTYCKCIGIDNNEYIVRQDALISGATHTIHGACAGGKKEDITGQRFGRLTAIKPTDGRAANGSIVWECLCDCGNITFTTANNLKREHTTSCGCAKIDFIESCKIDIIGKKFGKLTVIDEYQQSQKKRRMVRCKCECGNEHICSVTDLTTGHTASCGCFNRSKGEKYIEEILIGLDVEFEKQKRFIDCRNKKPLPFDFYIEKANTCIEYDGEQHYKPIEFWGGKKRFNDRQQNDRIKDEYCKNNDITLVRIPYIQTKDEIYNTIVNLMSPATITA